jgi:hypothetical protein
MIKSKPIISTQFAFGVFILVGMAICYYGLSQWWANRASWYHYAFILVFLPLSLFLLLKMILSLKSVEVWDEKIKVNFLLFPKKRDYALSDIVHWNEEVIKTGKNNTYRELEIKFHDNLRIRLAYREYSNYEKMLAYFTRKIPGRKRA